MIGMVGQRGMIDLLHQRMRCQIVHHLSCVFHMPFQAKRQRFQPLQQQESIERGQAGTGIPQKNGTDIGYERRRPGCLGERYAVVAGIRLGQVGKFP